MHKYCSTVMWAEMQECLSVLKKEVANVLSVHALFSSHSNKEQEFATDTHTKCIHFCRGDLMKCFHCDSVFSESVFNVGLLSVLEAIITLYCQTL